jgi:hypothetical protein
VFGVGNRGGNLLLSGLDLSALAATVGLTRFGSAPGRVLYRNCKLPANWTGALVAGPINSRGQRAMLVNCDSTDTNYRMQIADYSGSINEETTVVRSGGATDGVTGIAWRMTTNANALYPMNALEGEEILRWFPDTGIGEALGTTITVGVEVVHDSPANLKDDEAWVSVQSLNTSGVPYSAFTRDCKANILAPGVAQATSTATWNTTGLTAPKRQLLAVQITPQEAGYLIIKPVLAKPNTTMYVCPKVKVS